MIRQHRRKGTLVGEYWVTYNEYQARSHFANLDGLRFVCIAMVLWHHNSPIDKELLRIFERGFLGVDFFFVLSGFLITTLLLRERREFGEFSVKDFYHRRILRILPVYYFVIGMVSIYYVLIVGRSDLEKLVPFYFLFLSNFLTDHIPLLTITWSLSVEEQYYLVWPIALLLIPSRWLIPFSLLLIVLNVCGIVGIFGWQPISAGPLTFSLPNATYAPIIMGSLLAIILNTRDGFGALQGLLGGRFAAAANFVFLGLAMHSLPEDLRGLPNLLVHTLMTGTLAALVLREDNAFLSFLRNRTIARIGMVSYGIYLYHLIGLDVTNRSLTFFGVSSDWIVFVAYSTVSYAMAELSFRTLEAYFRRFRPTPRVKPVPHSRAVN